MERSRPGWLPVSTGPMLAHHFSSSERGLRRTRRISMKLKFKFLTILAACIGLLSAGRALFAAGGQISGQVVNGTTGSPVANQTIQLLMPRGGMQQVATA